MPSGTESPKTIIEKRQRTLAEAHLDISIGDSYRIEYIKHLLSIASGIFVFSVTFMKEIIGTNPTNAQLKIALVIGWVALVLSIVGGIAQMRLWSAFYISWGRDFDKLEAKRYRRHITTFRVFAEFIQIAGFVLGLLSLLAFAIRNIKL